MFKLPLFVLVTIVATFNLPLAQGQNDTSSGGHSFFGIPIPHFPFPIPQFQIPSFQFPPFQFPGIREQEVGAPADAEASSADHASSEHDDHQDRFFFNFFRPASTLVSCNYTTEGGTRCTTCTTALTCGSANVGRLQACRGFFPYCNLGRCSFYPGELCANSTG
ncbi:uncharacterized protein LOC125230851 [Leguminivora glycinivorella]|uniref:uncharacterized protein LOC125230851 n=1 Tax=Leguminivora glycinivorella TaxID=1035111 RepID=UPI00200CB4C4|nr:uncharacterized protein LOC125230851 [Leguminivora glycinivorella]